MILAPDGGVEPGMVGQRLDLLGPEPGGCLLHLGPAEAIDDPALALMPVADEGEELAPGIVLLGDGVADVRPIETGEVQLGAVEPEAPADILAGLGIGRGCQGETRHPGIALGEHGELQVFGPKVMAPLADAMGLVDGEESDLHAIEELQEGRQDEPFRSDVDEIEPVRPQIGAHAHPLFVGEAGVERGGADADLAQILHLVAHQRDQRRDDDPDALPAEGGNLIAQGLAAAGRHQDNGVPAGDDMRDDLRLMAAEFLVAEGRAQDVEGRSGVLAGSHDGIPAGEGSMGDIGHLSMIRRNGFARGRGGLEMEPVG